MFTKEEAYTQIAALVERFTEQLPSYKKSEYNETLTRKDFIDPFFKALGWDMNNSQGKAEAYREVIHEDKIKIGSASATIPNMTINRLIMNSSFSRNDAAITERKTTNQLIR